MRVLVTRPEEDASALAAALAARGFDALVEPMLSVAPAPGVTPPLDLDGVQALLFTSANGVRALARLTERRDLPAFTVGDARSLSAPMVPSIERRSTISETVPRAASQARSSASANR